MQTKNSGEHLFREKKQIAKNFKVKNVVGIVMNKTKLD